VPGTDPADRETLANLQPPREVPGTDFPGEIASFRRPVSECLAPIRRAIGVPGTE
jgi:hypothetical protein